MKKTIMRFMKDQSGVTAVEYALIAAMVSISIIGATTSIGGGAEERFQSIGDTVER